MSDMSSPTFKLPPNALAHIVHRTPVFTSRTFDALAGASVFFKCENFQRGGAFKIRGASNFLLSIPNDDLPRGVVTYSSGNHGQAVAIAAESRGISATIVMPADAPCFQARGYPFPRRANRHLRSRHRGSRSHRAAHRQRNRRYHRSSLRSSLDHHRPGHRSALELLAEVPDLDALVIPIGGGGLISGSAIAAHAIRPGIRIFGVEPEQGNDTLLSLRAGERIGIPLPETIADGLRATKPGALTFPIIQKHVEDIFLVSDSEIRDAMNFLLTRMKILVEPSGAASAAAVMLKKLPPGIAKIGVILSGGNVDTAKP